MNKGEKYQVLYHLSAMAKKTVLASSFEEARHLVESNEFVKPDEIIELIEPCKVYELHSLESGESELRKAHNIEFENWGSE